VVSRVLLQTPELTLGEFTCASGDRLWDEVNDIGDGAHVVFPQTRVMIEQDGAHPPGSASAATSTGERDGTDAAHGL